MRKVYRLEYQDKHWWMTVRPTWFPDDWESMEFCARIMLEINGERTFFRLWGKTRAKIVAAWEDGRYSDFCSTDTGEPIESNHLLQAVDYVVMRLGNFDNYLLQHHPKLLRFENGSAVTVEGKLYWLDCDEVAKYQLRVVDSDGNSPSPPPPFGKSEIIDRFYNLKRWETEKGSVNMRLAAPVRHPKSGRVTMMDCIEKEKIVVQVKATRIK